MKKIIIFALIVIGFTVCKQNLSAGVKKDSKMATSVINMDMSLIKNKINQCEIISKHPFSNQDRIDTFKLIYNCENLEDSMIFQITGFSGDIIFKERFSGTSFYDYSRPWYEYITDPKRGKGFDPDKLSIHISDSLHRADLQYIKERMDKFFSDKNFIANPMAKLDKNMFRKDNYNEISGDPTVIGFSYKLFEGGGFEMIGYSKKIKKVLLIATSD